MLNCERAGIGRFFIQSSAEDREKIIRDLGRFRQRRGVTIIESFGELLKESASLDPSEPCVRFEGNLVLSTWYLKQILRQNGPSTGGIVATLSADQEHGGSILVGRIADLIRTDIGETAAVHTASALPFALNGRPQDRDEAEGRVARSLKEETADKDGILARYVDRHISWRISRWLAHTSVTPNQVTIANTIVGLCSAWMFASASYWIRLAGAALFLFSVTMDGVDGELARLTMTESTFGGMLDVVTDNVVHAAIFAGLLMGCYRSSGSVAYIYLIPVLLLGFALCAIVTYRAFQVRGEQAEEWISRVDRITGRDFAYLLVILALIDRLSFFAWGTAFGTYIFAFILFWLTRRHERSGLDVEGI